MSRSSEWQIAGSARTTGAIRTQESSVRAASRRPKQQCGGGHSRPRDAKTPHEQESMQPQIATSDEQIDQLVCNLYELAEGEVEFVKKNRDS